MKKNQNGVTLIALAVTIIVMLILAGATMSVLSGDSGIMTNAKKSSASSEESDIIEKMGQAFNTLKTDIEMNSISGTEKTIDDYMELLVSEIGSSQAKTVATSDKAEDSKISIYTEADGTANKIVMVYKSKKFTLSTDPSADEVKKQRYKIITGTIKIDGDSVTYDAPEKSVK